MWFFASDLHGNMARYRKLFQAILVERPEVVLLGGDLLPNIPGQQPDQPGKDFVRHVLQSECAALKQQLGGAYPQVLLILGNDDPRSVEAGLWDGESQGLWHYIHNRHLECGSFSIYGYACVPPTPFMLKDWERYDVSRYVDPGCIGPEEGWLSVPRPANEMRFGTIQSDLEKLAGGHALTNAILLLHAPPYRTVLDRAALDGRKIDGVPVDVHIGSLAVRRFIEARQPLLSLHGHVHESARLTGTWQARLGRTFSWSAAHDGVELALIRFEPAEPEQAKRELL